MKKTVFFDTNMPNSDGSYYVDEIIITGKNLEVGDEVIAYQEGEEWEAIITYNDGWGVKLASSATEISVEKETGYKEGFWEGYYCQLLNLTKVLKQVEISEKDVYFILSKMGKC